MRLPGASSGKLPGDVRFKVEISGIAADAGDVAELICKLEDSPYFCQVYPSFSRNSRIKAGTVPWLGSDSSYTADDSYQISEFEIGCYLANYRQEQTYFAKEVQNKGVTR